MAKKVKLSNADDDFKGSGQDEIVLAKGGNDNVSGGGGNDTIKGGLGNDVLKGGAGDDALIGGEGNDILRGGAGDDTLNGGAGDNNVDGGEGDDTVVLAGNLADATITRDADGRYVIATASGTTTISGVELFRFADGTVDQAAIDDIIDNGVGETKDLQVGLDNITGTAEDDVYNAASVNPVSGAIAVTLNAFDTVDGGEGDDTLNIFTAVGGNVTQQGTIKNIETINIYTAAAATFNGASFDASKFAGATEVWQIGGTAVAGVTGLESTQTAGFKDLTTAVVASVTTAATAASANVALSNVVEGSSLTVSGAALNALNISGALVDGADAGTTVASMAVTATVGKDQQTFTLSSAADVTVTVAEAVGTTKNVTTFDAAASTGKVVFVGDADVATINGGKGDDTLTLATTTSATVSASLNGGDGKDTVTVSTTGAGTTTVDTGLGDDSVSVTSRSSGKLTVSLGDGSDSFTSAATITATDSIDGGAGTDSLALKVVGAANIGAFSNFEKFDAVGLNNNLDIGILASKNTVTEITSSGALAGPVTLSNIGAGVGFRATGDMGGTVLTLTQAAAGALTISQDIDETGTTAVATVAADRDADIVASNATSIKIDLDNDFVGAASPAATDNANDLNVTGTKATALEIVSGGDNAVNSVDFTGGISAVAGKDALATVTISGTQAIDFDYTAAGGGSSQLSVNASALTGALTFTTADLKAESAINSFDGGKLTLGSGDDVITLVQGAVVANVEKGSAENIAVQSNFDVFDFGATFVDQAADVASTGTYNVLNGKLTFEGTGPATLTDAIATADAAVVTANTAVVFEYLGDSYIFVEGAADTVVKLDDVTGLGGLDQLGASGDIYLI